jgi:hypothetical protein
MLAEVDDEVDTLPNAGKHGSRCVSSEETTGGGMRGAIFVKY